MRAVRVQTRPMSLIVVGSDGGERARLGETLAGQSAPGELAVQSVADAPAALAIFRREHPDLILISTADIDTVGREIALAVRQEEGLRHTGIIFIDHRALDDDGLSVACLEMGADDFLRHGAPASELMARVRAVLRLKAMTDELRTANHQLRILSLTDELTGLANMRSFNQSFGEAVRRCRQQQAPLAVLMLDLDHFKSVNDTTNHLVGSHVLAEVGRLLREAGVLGPADVAARYGGDEFIVLLSAATPAEATRRAETVRERLAARAFAKGGCEIRITASLGVAWVAPGFVGPAEDVVKAADMMLYRSKEHGRNRVSTMILGSRAELEDDGRRSTIAAAEIAAARLR